MSKTWGSFPDAFGCDDKLFTGGQLAKAVDKDDIDLEKMCAALELLNNRARRMNKAQLYRLNYKLGLAVNKFRDEVQKYISRPGATMNQGTMEKVHGNSMDDAGLDERRETVIPRTRSSETFTKGNRTSGGFGGGFGDAFGDDTTDK